MSDDAKRFIGEETNGGCIMGRIKLVGAVAVVVVAMLTVSLPPALADPSPSTSSSMVFFPVALGNGATYSCTGGPPFVFDGDDPSSGNCAVERIGKPEELVCDDPTSITFVHDLHEFAGEANICNRSTA